jgi:uncharacterized protein YjbI with pentapeptide repeats
MLVAFGCALIVLAPTAEASVPFPSGLSRLQSRFLDPGLFADLSSGIALVRTFNCGGTATGEGTGFLVGSSVVMTARHVTRGACRLKVSIDGGWVGVSGWTSWHKAGRADLNSADVATIKLKSQVSGHVFVIRTSSAAIGTNLAALGHPLGNDISLNQGNVVEKGRVAGIPMLAVRMLAAEGGSGSPLVDNHGNVVGILQLGLGASDILGQRTSGVILGIDLPSWWPTARTNLCHAYKSGGIPGCASSPPPSGSTGGGTTPPVRCKSPVRFADCHGLDFSFQNFAGADLTGTNFRSATLQGTNLSGTELSNAHFENAQLIGATLRDADLGSSFWSSANLEGAVLEGANLTYSFFDHSDLQGADLTNANLVGVNFTGADLRGATGIDISFLQEAATLCNTVLPDGTLSGC